MTTLTKSFRVTIARLALWLCLCTASLMLLYPLTSLRSMGIDFDIFATIGLSASIISEILIKYPHDILSLILKGGEIHAKDNSSP